MSVEGTTDNPAASSTGGVSSGTASAAMIKAAEASSSGASVPAGAAGDTSLPGGGGNPAASVAATTQPAATGQPDTTGTRGPIPFDRHEAALKNARDEAAKKAVEQYTWANGLNPDEVRWAMERAARLRKDPNAFYQQLGSELGTGRQPVDEALPEPDLVSEDGKTKAYSAAAMTKLLEVSQRKLIAQMKGEIQPLREFHDQQMTQAQRAEQDRIGSEIAGRALTSARSLPYFKENEKAIGEKLSAMDVTLRNEIGPVAAMLLSWGQLLAETVIPGLKSKTEEEVRDTMRKKAAAGSGQPHPVDQGGEGKKPQLRGPEDLARHMESLAASLSV